MNRLTMLTVSAIGLISITFLQSCSILPSKASRPKDLTTVIESDYIRLERSIYGSSLKTAIRTFAPKDPSYPIITLVSAAHGGTENYFRRHQDLLNALDVVLFEMPYDWQPKPMKDTCDELVAFEGLEMELATGLKEQYSFMDYRKPNFRKADLPNEEFLKASKLSHMFKMTESSCRAHLEDVLGDNLETLTNLIPVCKRSSEPFLCVAKEFASTLRKSPAEQRKIKTDFIHKLHLEMIEKRAKLGPWKMNPDYLGSLDNHSKYLRDEREALVRKMLKEIVDAKSTKTLGILYGASHMPRFEIILRDMGYDLTSQEWVEALNYSNLSS